MLFNRQTTENIAHMLLFHFYFLLELITWVFSPHSFKFLQTLFLNSSNGNGLSFCVTTLHGCLKFVPMCYVNIYKSGSALDPPSSFGKIQIYGFSFGLLCVYVCGGEVLGAWKPRKWVFYVL